MMQTNTVAIGFNNKMTVEEAANAIGCSVAQIRILLNRKTLKGQRVGKQWILDSQDVYKYKESGAYKKRAKFIRKPIVPTIVEASTIKLTFDIEKDKFDLLKMVLASKNKTVAQYVSAQINNLVITVTKQLSDIAV